MADNSSVKVAVRVRPLVDHELQRGCQNILEVIDVNDQIIVKSTDKDKAFTFNYTLSAHTPQEELYNRCVKHLIENLFKGYNVTILAYGQTGSGKTHSMGTAYSGQEDTGVIPRAVSDIFENVKDNFSYDFSVSVSFLELYQEIIYDLLADKPREQCILDIREDLQKGVYIPRLTELPVTSVNQVLEILKKGSLGRATGATSMNSHSSRSHAVFTLNIAMNHKSDSKENKQSKLHLVDLAGSERPKKTGAVGNTFKEGVNINKGLFVLGNVISCLGDEKTQNGYIPYRDSNLTRLLKDSLGGNSITLMIACVSPADYNMDETLSTLRYADRARKIKNKPIVNQDARVAEINELKKTIQQLRLQILGQGGPMVSCAEIETLKIEIVTLKLKIRDLTCQLSAALFDNTSLHEKLIIFQNSNEVLSKKIQELKEAYDITVTNISLGIDRNDREKIKENLVKLQDIQQQFVTIDNDQKKTEEELREHEVSFNQYLMRDGQEDDQKELDENHELHTKRQLDLNTQLSEIQKQLIIKEGLAKQLNNQYVIDYDAMAENEAKIANLQREKDELLELLKNVGESGKLSEHRRKRVEELESKLTELKKKVAEQAKLIKLKAGNEDKINKLNNEIVLMKQTKVKLIRTMREESDKFKQWRLEKERECIRLKEQDRKKANEITKMKAMHNKQQIVFRRRMEQAEATNKRLKSALATRQQVQESKNVGKVEKIEPWLKEEYNLFVSIAEAEATLKQLLEDRAVMQQQLDCLKSNPETSESLECKTLQDDLELRTVQIQDIQQKLLSSDEDNKAKVRFDKFQTMSEAKYGLKFLFAKANKVHKEKMQIQYKLTEIQDSLDDMTEKLKNCEEENRKLKDNKAQELANVKEEFDSFSNMLKCTFDVKELELQNAMESKDRVIQDQKEEIMKLENKIKYIEQMAKDHVDQISTPKAQITRPTNYLKVPSTADLNNTFCVKKDQGEGNISNNSTEAISEKDNTYDDEETEFEPNVFPQTEEMKQKRKKRTNLAGPNRLNDAVLVPTVSDDLDISNNDNPDKDPDWRFTPLGKRIIKERQELTLTKLEFGEEPSKRSSEGGCTCKTTCARGRCGCKKVGIFCSSSCRCSDIRCMNREQVSNNIENSSMEEKLSDSDGSFKKPKFSDENVAPKKVKKSRKLFDASS